MADIIKPMPGCEICRIIKLLPPEFTLQDGQYWNANLAHLDQALLGRAFITLKRHASELDELLPEEEQEFITIRNSLIRAIRRSFQPLTFNISCLKNDAFKTDPDHTPSSMAHVHWHVIPRYSSPPVDFAGKAFIDPMPGRYLERAKLSRDLDTTTLAHITKTIRKNL